MFVITIIVLCLFLQVDSFLNKLHIKKNILKLNKRITQKDFKYVFEDNIDESIYIIIWKNDNKTVKNKIIEDLEYYNLKYLLCEFKEYDTNELVKIYYKHIRLLNDFDYNNQPWIFKDEKFIGGIFEFYANLYLKELSI
jgi:hypothetical protein